MEKQKSGESSTFICTECGDGFRQYSSVLAHMVVHGPLEAFSFDGSSNGFQVPREYVLQENGTLTVVNELAQSQYSVKPVSPGILPSHLPPPMKPVSPTLRSQLSPHRDVLRPKTSDFTLDKSRQGNYRCEICSRSFNSLQSLHRHQQYRNTERGYKCTLCCKIFEGRHDLKKHLQDHAHECFHHCIHCGKRFLKMDALNAHQKENHFSPNPSLGKSENSMEKKTEKAYSCKKCMLNFFWMSDFQTHSMYHCKGKEPDTAFPSEIEVEVNSKNIEDIPLENFHSNGTSVGVERGANKNVWNANNLSDAGNTVNPAYSFTPYRCGLCGDRFHKLTDLKEHHLSHQTQEEIDQLNQESLKSSKIKIQPKMRRRSRSNPNGRLHPCKHCHRVFNHSSSLSRHMRYHKGTMHTCVFCGRHFPQRCDLRRHIVMYHKAELEKKPALKLLYTTPHSRPTPKSLNRETIPPSPDEKTKSSSDTEQTTSPEQSPNEKQSGKAGRVSYKCQECGKRFGLLSVYQRHLRYHKKEPSTCPQCPAQFMNSLSLELHLQTHPSTRRDDVEQTSHCYGTNRDPLQEKGIGEDIEDDCVDHAQNDKGNSSEVLYECTECTETFACLETFLHHQISHGSENSG